MNTRSFQSDNPVFQVLDSAKKLLTTNSQPVRICSERWLNHWKYILGNLPIFSYCHDLKHLSSDMNWYNQLGKHQEDYFEFDLRSSYRQGLNKYRAVFRHIFLKHVVVYRSCGSHNNCSTFNPLNITARPETSWKFLLKRTRHIVYLVMNICLRNRSYLRHFQSVQIYTFKYK